MTTTTIQLEKTTRDRLASVGRKDDTFDDIVNHVLDEVGEQRG